MLKEIIIFTTGIGIGVGATLFIVKDKYKKQYEEECNEKVAAVRDNYNRKLEELNSPIDIIREKREKAEYNLVKPDISKVDEILSRYESNATAPVETDKPYTISPEVFAMNANHFNQVDLTYYADDVLVNEVEDVIDPSGTIGLDALNRFGEYESDVVYVRNEKLATDYSVIRESITWEEFNRSL